jgi:NAD(P)-dependent dehydrogenase (short-subunit alcohol dehydrogenase family)
MIPDTDDIRLDDRVVLITGAGDGIGKAVALACAGRGATVILLGRTVHKLEQVYDDIKNSGGPEPAIYPMNLEGATPQDYDDLQANIDREFGRLDALLNNAGWLGASTPIEIYDVELWYKVMQVNLNAPFLLTRACIPLLRKSGAGRIVFTADEKSSAYWGAYGVAKAGQLSLMQILADERGQHRPGSHAFQDHGLPRGRHAAADEAGRSHRCVCVFIERRGGGNGEDIQA